VNKVRRKLAKFFKSRLGKLVLEAGRWAVLGAVAVILVRLGLVEVFVELVPWLEEGLSAGDVTVVLRLIDLLLHKSGYAQKGLTRF